MSPGFPSESGRIILWTFKILKAFNVGLHKAILTYTVLVFQCAVHLGLLCRFLAPASDGVQFIILPDVGLLYSNRENAHINQ